jgi:prepilin-type N-terminal cleavage/methylation domain-containing protein
MEPFHLRRGFTLIELMVVLAIIVTITTIALMNQSSFNKTLILANTAYDIALTLRSAQSFGIGSRATTLGTANAGYGLHFQTGTPGSFILFADTNLPNASNCHGLPFSGNISAPDAQPGNCIYDSGADTLTQTYVLGNGITVSNLCAYSSSWYCALSSLDIVFARPNPDAFINAGGFSYTAACLTITSPQGGLRSVSVAASGAITVSASPCS